MEQLVQLRHTFGGGSKPPMLRTCRTSPSPFRVCSTKQIRLLRPKANDQSFNSHYGSHGHWPDNHAGTCGKPNKDHGIGKTSPLPPTDARGMVKGRPTNTKAAASTLLLSFNHPWLPSWTKQLETSPSVRSITSCTLVNTHQRGPETTQNKQYSSSSKM